MILDRHNRVNAAELYARLHSNEAANESSNVSSNVDNTKNQQNCSQCGKTNSLMLPEDQIDEFVNMMQIYEGAMYEISTKLEILDSEFQVRFS
ncbi:(p)ppGpp synthetase, partial [Bifidobacteriaceae bacterium NR016]